MEFSAVSVQSSCVCLKPLPCIESLMLSLLAAFVSDLTFFGFSDIFEISVISDIYQGQLENVNINLIEPCHFYGMSHGPTDQPVLGRSWAGPRTVPDQSKTGLRRSVDP